MGQKKEMRTKLSAAGMLVAMGVVYGDIGTSPLYVMKAIVEGNGGLATMSETMIIGVVSLIFWTLTLLTTIKYVVIALNADNKGEGGIFSLFTLVRRQAAYLIIPAMIGGAALLADGILTPAVTVTTAVEGLRDLPVFVNLFGNQQSTIVLITLAILLLLFGMQRFGTEAVGKAFGPIMLGWFTFLGGLGLSYFVQDWTVLRALNPYYAVQLLFSEQNKLGLFILGNIFLATTGAEALYSDLGHVGKQNIRFSWPYVKICLVLNYFGQAAWILKNQGNQALNSMADLNPFFHMMPSQLRIFGVLFATVAAIIASQALISGSFTLVSEAIKLKLLPRLKIIFPGSSIGQMYIPTVNLILWLACSLVVILFQTSTRMEAAYGLSITVTMLMTTLLLFYYMRRQHVARLVAFFVTLFFGTIEFVFFLSSLKKFFHGGYVAVAIALVILAVMYIWLRGHQIQSRGLQRVSLRKYLPQMNQLRHDERYPIYQTNIVFLVPELNEDKMDRRFIYSILDKHPKRAHVYWFVHVEVTDEPYTQEYTVDMVGTDFVIKCKLYLGFRVHQSVNVYLRQIVSDLMEQGRLAKQPQQYSIMEGREVGDFRFVIIEEELSNMSRMPKWDRQVIQAQLFIKKYTMSPESWFGLKYGDVVKEIVPMYLGEPLHSHLRERAEGRKEATAKEANE